MLDGKYWAAYECSASNEILRLGWNFTVKYHTVMHGHWYTWWVKGGQATIWTSIPLRIVLNLFASLYLSYSCALFFQNMFTRTKHELGIMYMPAKYLSNAILLD
jgi:hypothetical protein